MRFILIKDGTQIVKRSDDPNALRQEALELAETFPQASYELATLTRRIRSTKTPAQYQVQDEVIT